MTRIKDLQYMAVLGLGTEASNTGPQLLVSANGYKRAKV